MPKDYRDLYASVQSIAPVLRSLEKTRQRQVFIENKNAKHKAKRLSKKRYVFK